MEEDLFDGYSAGMMLPSRIAQLSVDATPKTFDVPTLGTILSKQTEAIPLSVGVSAQIKNSPIVAPAAISQEESSSVPEASVISNISNSTNSTVNNSVDDRKYTADYAAAQLTLGNLLSEISKTNTIDKENSEKFEMQDRVTSSPEYLINKIPTAIDTAPTQSFNKPLSPINLPPIASETGPTKSSSLLDLANLAAAASPVKPSSLLDVTNQINPSSSVNVVGITERSENNLLNLPSVGNAISPGGVLNSTSNNITGGSTTGPIDNSISPSTVSLAEYSKFISGDSFDVSDNSSTSNQQSTNTSNALNTPSVEQTSQAIGDQAKVSVQSTSPIKNKSIVNQIVNPPNPVAQGVDNLSKVITNTSSSMTSSLTNSISNMAKADATKPIDSSQTITNNTNSIIGPAGQPQATADPTAPANGQPINVATGSGMSDHLLSAIYDALVIQGIKIRNI